MILYIWIGCLTLAFCISLVWVYKKIEEFQKDIKCLLKDVERVDKVQKEEFKRKMEKKEKHQQRRGHSIIALSFLISVKEVHLT